jgi:hypothetical protein
VEGITSYHMLYDFRRTSQVKDQNLTEKTAELSKPVIMFSVMIYTVYN